MTGSLVKYNTRSSDIDYIGVILEYREGFHIKKSWSDNWQLVSRPMCRVYWFREPGEKPVSAKVEITKEWRSDEDINFGFGHPDTFSEGSRSIIEEWDMLLKEKEWYFMKNFKIVERCCDV